MRLSLCNVLSSFIVCQCFNRVLLTFNWASHCPEGKLYMLGESLFWVWCADWTIMNLTSTGRFSVVPIRILFLFLVKVNRMFTLKVITVVRLKSFKDSTTSYEKSIKHLVSQILILSYTNLWVTLSLSLSLQLTPLVKTNRRQVQLVISPPSPGQIHFIIHYSFKMTITFRMRHKLFILVLKSFTVPCISSYLTN